MLGVAAAISGVVAVSNAMLRSLPLKQFDRLITATFIVTRFAVYLGLFVILRLPPRGDVPSYYWGQAVLTLQGLLPYRDFASSYAPLHPFLDAALIRLWFSPLAIILFSLLAECLLVPLWLRLGRRIFTDQQVRIGALLYVTSAISLQFVAIDGQDNVVIAVLFALAILLLDRRPFLSGAAVGLGAVSIKFLPLAYAPLFFIGALRRWRWLAGLALPVVLVYGAFAARHLQVLSALSKEAGLKSANNLPYLMESVLGVTLPSRLCDGVTAIVLFVIFSLVARTVAQGSSGLRLQSLVFGTAGTTLAIVLFAKKSWPPYLMLALFPICFLASSRSKLKTAGFGLFGVVAVVAPSYWSTVLAQFSSEKFRQGLLAGQTTCYFLLALQTLLIAGYAWLLMTCVQRLLSMERKETERLQETASVS